MPIKHHIICIHGIGKHSTDWINDIDDGDISFKTLLGNLWGKFPTAKKKGQFDEYVAMHSVHYDDEIDKIFDSWQQQSETIKNSIKLSPLLLDQIDWFTKVTCPLPAVPAEWK